MHCSPRIGFCFHHFYLILNLQLNIGSIYMKKKKLSLPTSLNRHWFKMPFHQAIIASSNHQVHDKWPLNWFFHFNNDWPDPLIRLPIIKWFFFALVLVDFLFACKVQWLRSYLLGSSFLNMTFIEHESFNK